MACRLVAESNEEFGAFWERKMRTLFNVLDTDKDGVLTARDFEAIADEVDSMEGVPEEKREKLRNNFVEKVRKTSFNPLNSDEPSDAEKFIQSLKNIGKADMPQFHGDNADVFFEAFDANNDGVISQEEFRKFYASHKIDQSYAGQAFEAIDADQDGNISKDEFKEAIINFFVSEEESPFSCMFGALTA